MIADSFQNLDTLSSAKTILAGLCAVLAIAQVAVEATVKKELRSHSNSGTNLSTPGEATKFLDYVPAHINYAVNNLLIASSSITLAVSLLCIGATAQKQNAHRSIMVAISCVQGN